MLGMDPSIQAETQSPAISAGGGALLFNCSACLPAVWALISPQTCIWYLLFARDIQLWKISFDSSLVRLQHGTTRLRLLLEMLCMPAPRGHCLSSAPMGRAAGVWDKAGDPAFYDSRSLYCSLSDLFLFWGQLNILLTPSLNIPMLLPFFFYCLF